MLVATFTVGCGISPNDVRTTMTTNGTTNGTTSGERARELALESAHRTLRALELDAGGAEVHGATRVTACTDSLGQETDEHFAEYSSGSAIDDGTLTDDQVDALEARLGVTFLEDGVDATGTRLVSFVLRIDGHDVVVRLSRNTDGSGTLTTSTPCTS